MLRPIIQLSGSTRAAVVGLIWTWLMTAPCHAETLDVWIGTTTPQGGESRGIYYAAFNTASGQLAHVHLAAEISGPGFVVLHPSGDRLYAIAQFEGQGSVVAYRIIRGQPSPQLEFRGALPIGDGGGTHLAVDATGRFLFTAQYGGGSVAMFQLDEDGDLLRRTQLVEHIGGSGVVADRQASPHPHWVGLSPDNRFLLVPDLGLDEILVYRVDPATASLAPHATARVSPGAGPRHLKFHPSRRTVYVLNELSLTVAVFRYDPEQGELQSVQEIVALPEDLIELPSSGSEIRVHPTGKFVYTANRGHDTITVFAVEDENQRLRFVEREPIRGSWPRNFNVSPDGRYLLAAGRDSSTLAVFSIDPQQGNLTFTRQIAHVPTPICVTFGPAPAAATSATP